MLLDCFQAVPHSYDLTISTETYGGGRVPETCEKLFEQGAIEKLSNTYSSK
ncbi:hypothetical protein [Pontibacter pamirensis]|uniref:hypothetical protein n=1 Tax=Pontibacter pamirensis TaxID=2562824 RepID=UPI0013895584|nr:hypothetical protein [Pontibacter pamirensis]